LSDDSKKDFSSRAQAAFVAQFDESMTTGDRQSPDDSRDEPLSPSALKKQYWGYDEDNTFEDERLYAHVHIAG
jgi:hypothetical protein